ncbi:MAG: site-specific DNA-methyltransferase, partial [Deltaproteobacteria bacterium]|nr:site-specific DNA-methyltransferase [Deltaproteobacteria bacterium]
DAWGNPVINPEFNPEMLAEALCKLENFTYAPSQDIFWIHGQSSERDFIYVTTRFLTQDMLAHIAAELTPERSLLICCGAYSANPDAFPNITLKKIPKAVLDKCEWGHDDYSLAVENLPKAEVRAVQAKAPSATGKNQKSASGQISLFDTPGGR